MKKPEKKILSVFSVAFFLFSVTGPVGTAFAADDWPLWPRKQMTPPAAPSPGDQPPSEPAAPPKDGIKVEVVTPEEAAKPPGEDKAKPAAAAVAKAGETAGAKTGAGISAGTVTKAALIGAGVIAVGVALGGGGGGGGTTSVHP